MSPLSPSGRASLAVFAVVLAGCGSSSLAPATCDDGARNAAETDVDCGGGACPACATGKACASASDCESAFCSSNVCADRIAPVITSFATAASTLTSGGATTLDAVFTGGTGVVDHGIGAVVSGFPRMTAALAETTTFTLTVTNRAGDAVTASATVTVVPPAAIASFTAEAATLTSGGSTTLTAVFSGGTGIVDQGLGDVSSGAPVSTGPLTETTTFTLTVTNPAGDAVTASATVTVVPPAAITSFAAAEPLVLRGTGTTLLALFADGTGAIDQNIGLVSSGVAVATGNLDGGTNFTLTVTNAAQDAVSATVLVGVADAPAIASFTAGTLLLESGTSTELTAVFSNGTGTIDQGLGPVTSDVPISTGNLVENTRYTLEVTGAANSTPATSQLLVRVEGTCADGQWTGDEVVKDCGGGCPCAEGDPCSADGDCASGFCHPVNLTCTAPSCADGYTNGSETDLNCGGSCSTKCAVGQHCLVGSDCAESICDDATKTCLAPTCRDGAQNGGETSIDCGGSCTDCRLFEMKVCIDGFDSLHIKGNEVWFVHWGDSVPAFHGDCSRFSLYGFVAVDQSQWNIDWSGGSGVGSASDHFSFPGPALAAQAESVVVDSIAARIPISISQQPTAANGYEAVIEFTDWAGGSYPYDFIVRSASCSDGVKNGAESDVDCGGSCALCLANATCLAPTDCRSGACAGGLCASSLVSAWSFDEGTGPVAHDAAGVNPAEIAGATWAPSSECMSGSCLRFTDGTVAQVLEPQGLPLGAEPRTVEFWFSPEKDLTASTESCLFQYGTPAGGNMFGVITSGNAPGRLYFYGHSADLAGQTVLTPSTWRHGAVTFDGSTVTLFVDGAVEAQGAPGLSTVLDANGLTIGLRPGGSSWTGLIDEVRLYRSALPASVIRDHALQTHLTTCGDGLLDGDESDVDCGGLCSPCGAGFHCLADTDCASRGCVSGTCAASSCTNRFQDGDELAVDCGPSCPCDLGKTCAQNGDCASGPCASLACTVATGCTGVLSSVPGRPSGAYFIDPDGEGGNAPFKATCDMVSHGGGWTLVGKLGQDTPSTAKGALDRDRGLASLSAGEAPAAAEFSTFKLGRFDAWGSTWTVRTATDANNDGSHFQYAFFRPDAGQTLLPSEAGANWAGSTSIQDRLVHLVTSTTTGQGNTTWLPVQRWDLSGSQTMVLFSYRRGDLVSPSYQCLSAGQTAVCHSPSGGLHNESGFTGTYTAAFAYEDAVPHQHGRRATYWIKDVNTADVHAPGLHDSSASAHVMTPSGNANLAPVPSPFGSHSLSLDGLGDSLSTPLSPDFDLGTGAFTIDWWMRPTAAGVGQCYLFGASNPNGALGWDVRFNGNDIALVGFNGWDFNASSTGGIVATDQWTHVAVVGDGSSVVLYVNGTQAALPTPAQSVGAPAIDFRIGARPTGFLGTDYNGYVAEFRISKGLARWTSSFSVPTAAPSPGSSDVLLLHLDAP